VEGGPHLGDPKIPCEWCGMLSAPGAICEVCGSPLPPGASIEIDPKDAGRRPEEALQRQGGADAPLASGERDSPPDRAGLGDEPGSASPVTSPSPVGSPSSHASMSEELASLASLDRVAQEPLPEPTREDLATPTFDHGPVGPSTEGRTGGPPPSDGDGKACSRCGRPSEHKLCDACREAFRQLQELSLGLGGDQS
jgi:hypothetical protein